MVAGDTVNGHAAAPVDSTGQLDDRERRQLDVVRRFGTVGSLLLAQWQNGTLQVVGPKTAATSTTVVYPKPAWGSR